MGKFFSSSTEQITIANNVLTDYSINKGLTCAYGELLDLHTIF